MAGCSFQEKDLADASDSDSESSDDSDIEDIVELAETCLSAATLIQVQNNIQQDKSVLS